MPLPTRYIGADSVPFPGLGAMGMSIPFYSSLQQKEKSDEDMIAVLKEAYDSGCRFWDTADMYGLYMGQNEQLIGKAIKELKIPRKDVFIATKFGHFRKDGKTEIIGTPAYVKQAIEKSLKDLDMDYVDLYYQHRVDPKTPIEDTVKAMKELQDAGKIRYIGLSECSVETLRRASKVAKIDALQVEYSLWETAIETPGGLLDTCKELGIALVAYSPLGRGILSGAIKSRDDLADNDWRKSQPRFSEQNFSKNMVLVDRLHTYAKNKGCTASQLALAWVHAQWDGILAIPGTTRLQALKENLQSVHVHLAWDELAEIREVLQSLQVHGNRYDDMSTVNL